MDIEPARGFIFPAATVDAEALREPGAESASALHFNEVAGDGDNQEKRDEEIVEEEEEETLHKPERA